MAQILPWLSGVCRTNFGILTELFGGDNWSKSIKRSDSDGLVSDEIGIASLLDDVWKQNRTKKVVHNCKWNAN